MHRRQFLPLFLGTTALLPGRALPQSGSSDFFEISISEIPENAGIASEMLKQEENDYLFIPPGFRYRISVETTGKIESLTADELDTLKKWGTFVGRPDFTTLFQQKIEVKAVSDNQWIFWQSTLIQPFREELSQGGKMTINTLLLGARRQRPLLLGIGFRSS